MQFFLAMSPTTNIRGEGELMKKSILSIVTILAVFTMFGCGPLKDFDVPCVEIEDMQLPDICKYMDKVCNMAMTPPSICERLDIPPENCENYFGGEWDIDSGTCQDLQPVDGSCAEDDDCEEDLVCIEDSCAESV